MRKLKMLLAAAAITLSSAAIATPAIVAATPASATTFPEICGNDGTGYCIFNDGGDFAVSVNNGSQTGAGFTWVGINPCNSTPANRVTETCPFTVGTGMNSRHVSEEILRVQDLNSGLCVGTDGNGNGTETGCGNSAGSGLGNGGMMVQHFTGHGGFNLIDRFYSDKFGQENYVTSPGTRGFLLQMFNINPVTEWNVVFQA